MRIYLARRSLAIVLSISAICHADPVDERPARPRIEASAAGGVSYRTFFGIPTMMGSLDLGLGVRLREHLAVHSGLDFDLGQTDHALATRRYDFSPTVEWIAGRIRCGGGLDLLWFDVKRASTGERIGQAGAGAHVQTSIDPFQSFAMSMFVGARAGVDLMIGPPTIVSGSMLGASVIGGLRF